MVARKEGTTPKRISTYLCHGVELHESTSSNWIGDCPYCGKEDHFYVGERTGQFDCKRCGEKGNQITFLTQMAQECHEALSPRRRRRLLADRGTVVIAKKEYSVELPNSAIDAFKVGYNLMTGEYLVPCISEKGTVRDLRRWRIGKKARSTTGMTAQLGGVHRFRRSSRIGRIWLCEGEWDAIVLSWLLRSADLGGVDEVCWVPGANTFKNEFLDHLSNRHVVLCYDNDTPGDRGCATAYEKCKPVCRSTEVVAWPEELPDGYDMRDFVISQLAMDNEPQNVVDHLQSLIQEQPRRSFNEPAEVGDEDEPLEEDDAGDVIEFDELVRTFEKHALMDDQMIDALKVIAAVILSTPLENDPLWVYLVGAPGSGKTMLLSSLQDARKCRFVSSVSPHSLVSGWKGERSDPSLIPQLRGKTLVAKDFTEILTMAPMAQDEVFSTLRGAYDGYVLRPFGNGITREYKGCYFSLIAGVTSAVHGHSKASLGERFLKYQLNSPDRDHGNAVIRAAIRNVGREKAMEDELKTTMRRFLKKSIDLENLPTIPPSFIRRLISLVNLVAVLRAQVDRDVRHDEVKFRPAPEIGTRLAKQLSKLAMMLCVVEGKRQVDEAVFKLVRKVAYDTAHRLHLDIIDAIMVYGGSASLAEIVNETNLPATTLIRRLDDLVVLTAIAKTKAPSTGGRPAAVYNVTEHVRDLWSRVSGKEKAA